MTLEDTYQRPTAANTAPLHQCRSGRLEGKVCLVTGAGSGIGQATARLFAREGATLAVADVDDSGAQATVAAISDAGGTAIREHLDVADEEQTIAAVASVVARFSRIDVLFNNAGISGVGDVVETAPELFDRVMAVNVRGVYLMCRAVVPTMIEQRSGAIINMSSSLAAIGVARRVSYAASKGAVLAMFWNDFNAESHPLWYDGQAMTSA